MGAEAYPAWLGRAVVPLTLLCGPPGAGKSTYARAHTQQRDIVIDLDDIRAEVTGLPLYQRSQGSLDLALRRRNETLRALTVYPCRFSGAWLIASAPLRWQRDFWRARGARVVVIETPLTDCTTRIGADGARQDKDYHAALARQWWSRYQPDPIDEVMRPPKPPGVSRPQAGVVFERGSVSDPQK